MTNTAHDWPATAPAPPPASAGAGPTPRRTGLAILAGFAALVVGGGIGLAIGTATRSSSSAPVATAPSSAPSTAAATRARQLYRQALDAANASAGFHYVAVSSGAGTTQRIVGDAGQSSGTQTITMSSTYGPEQFSLVLSGGTVYLRGNAAALQDQLGVPSAKASSLVGSWVSVSNADGPYSIVAPGITVADQVQETILVPVSSASSAGGMVRIVGTVPAQAGSGGSGHLDVASQSHLPVSYVVKSTGSAGTTTSSTTFSGWGTAPTVTVPTGAVGWSTLGASEPPGGYGSGGTSSSQTPAA